MSCGLFTSTPPRTRRSFSGSYAIAHSASTNPQQPAVVLLSGGLDSATVLAIARSQGSPDRRGFACYTLAFDYGQRHRHELVAAAQVSRALGAINHRVVSIDLRAIGGSALTANIDVPKDRSAAEMADGRGGSGGGDGPGGASTGGAIPITYVPARNLTFLSIAAGYAEVIGARDIFIGVNAVDYSGYPDCRPEFIAAFEHAANLGTQAGVESDVAHRLRVHAPLVHLTKAQIINRGIALGVDFGLTHSCYDPIRAEGRKPQVPGEDATTSNTVEVLACGRCDSCTLRREGFRAAGVADPTRYA